MPDPTELFGGILGSENVDPNVARGYINQHRGAMAGRDAEINDVKAKQQASIDQMSKLLDETVASLRASREGRSNLPLMALGAGMMASPGNFGQQVGAGLKMMVPTIAAQRDEEDQFQNNLSNIGLKRAAITNAPLDEQLRYLKALQVGDINAIRGIESSIIKASGKNARDGRTAHEKNYERYLQEVPPGTKPMSFNEYREYESRLGADKNSPSIVQEVREVNEQLKREGKPPIGVLEYQKMKSGAQASGKAEGTASAEALAALPEAVNTAEIMAGTISKLEQSPGLPKLFGLAGQLPNWPGGEAADAEAIIRQLKSRAFTTMFHTLKGGGAITQPEGEKATDALANLSTQQSEKQFRETLKEINDVLAKGIKVARQKAKLEPMQTDITPKTATETPSLGAFDPNATYKEGTLRMNRTTKEKEIFRNGKWEKFGG